MKCFKYSSPDEYYTEINKILEKLEEINNINVSSILIENANLIIKNNNLNSQNIATNIKILNLYNCKLKTLDEFKNQILFVEEINFSCNFLDHFDMTSINKKLRSIDLSNNLITEIENYNEDYLEHIEFLDISFNKISNFKIIINFLNFAIKLQNFLFYCNPLKQKFYDEIDNIYLSKLDQTITKDLLSKLNYLIDNDKKVDYTSIVEKQLNKITFQNNLKQFDIIYDNYSFTDKYVNFSCKDIFKEKSNINYYIII